MPTLLLTSLSTDRLRVPTICAVNRYRVKTVCPCCVATKSFAAKHNETKKAPSHRSLITYVRVVAFLTRPRIRISCFLPVFDSLLWTHPPPQVTLSGTASCPSHVVFTWSYCMLLLPQCIKPRMNFRVSDSAKDLRWLCRMRTSPN